MRAPEAQWLSPPWLLASVATAVAVIGLGLRLWGSEWGGHPELEGRRAVAGLEAPLVLVRDRRGVPHVEAGSEADAYFGLGYAHAQDRPAQMEWLRRLARGRLAEILGEEALAADRRARLLGLGRHADATWERMPSSGRALLAAYAAGVNAIFVGRGGADGDEGSAAVSPAFEAWGITPEPWRPADSLAIAKLLAWGLGGTLEESLVLSDLIVRLGGLEARLFFPGGVAASGLAGAPSLPASSIWEAARVEPSLPGVSSYPVLAPKERAGTGWLPLRERVGLLGASAGSSAWVVAPRHSRSGGVLLAADAHFAPSVPAAWYQAHLRGGSLDVAGAGVPGLPVFWTGFNRYVAWASTHAGVTVSDLYVESLHPGDPSRYHDGRRWRSLRERREEIQVRGGRPHTLVVRETRHGPLVNPLLAREREPLALRWTGAESSRGIDAMLRVARSVSAPALRRALADHHEPVLAVAYADFAGEAGLQVAGSVPARAQRGGLLPMPGRDPAFAWRGRVPRAALPAWRLDAAADGGFLVAADGLPAAQPARGRATEGSEAAGGENSESPESEADASALEWLWHAGHRQTRAEALLAVRTGRGDLDLRALAALQIDPRSQGAEAVVQAALAVADPAALAEPSAAEAVAILRAWDFDASAESTGAAVYHLFLARLVRELFEPVLGEELLERYLGLGRVDPTRLVEAVLGGAGGSLFDVAPAVERSLRDLGYRLPVELGVNRAKWQWGRLHALRFEPLWTRGAPESIGPFPFAGDGTSLLAAEYRPLGSFAPRSAATFRMLVDTAALDEALTALAPGQSEQPGHPHHADGLGPWLEGRTGLLATSPLAVEDAAVTRLVLEPLAADPGRVPATEPPALGSDEPHGPDEEDDEHPKSGSDGGVASDAESELESEFEFESDLAEHGDLGALAPDLVAGS